MEFTAEAYVEDVLAGRVVVGRWARLACERHRRDVATGHERGLWFDERAAQFAVAFFHLLPLWEGEWGGRPLVLEPAQQFWVWSLFGWKRADGMRRFRTAYLEVGRKNAKTTWAAGIGLLMAFFDGEPGAQVYSAATKRDQALLLMILNADFVDASVVKSACVKVVTGSCGTCKLFASLDALTLSALIVRAKLTDAIGSSNCRGVILASAGTSAISIAPILRLTCSPLL